MPHERPLEPNYSAKQFVAEYTLMFCSNGQKKMETTFQETNFLVDIPYMS